MKIFSLILLFISQLNATDMRSLLFHGNCTTCHFEKKAVSAPSVMEFKESYLRAFPIKKDFVEYMSKWVLKPNKETSIMLDAIDKHELMPELGFDLTTLMEISSYIYDTDFTKEHEGHKE
ncbi:MAG: cytochrome C [Campylobacterota bacterium]|nr:cytochrome C [Campylobacterota bacterium]